MRRAPRAVFLDCDGVVVETAEMKRRAYLALFDGERAQWPAIDAYHRSNSGLGRGQQIAHVYAEILRRPLSRGQHARLMARYGSLVFRKTLRRPLVRGARAFLRQASAKAPVYLVSGAPTAELRRFVKARRLSPYFTEIRGAPEAKANILRDLLRRLGIPAAAAVFVGDALSDRQAARAARVPFVARVAPGSRSPFPAAVPKVRDLAALGRRLWRD